MRGAWVIAVLGLGCSGDPVAAPFDTAPRVVTVEALQPAPPTRRLVAVAEPVRDVALVPLRGGRVLERPHDPGAVVAEGALLLRLDARESRARLLTAEAGVREAEAAVVDARRQRERVEALGDSASGAQLDAVVLGVDRAVAAAERARAQRDLARVDLSELSLRAPFDGVLTALEPEVGAVVGAGAPVGRLVDAATLRVRVGLLEDEVAHAREASFVVVGGGAEVAAPLHWVAPASDPRTGDWAAELRVHDAPFPAGSPVEVRLVLPAPDADAVVPREAVTDGAVWLVEDGDGRRVKRVSVRVIGRSAEGLLVRGLDPGSRVVLRAMDVLADGVEVVALEARP